MTLQRCYELMLAIALIGMAHLPDAGAQTLPSRGKATWHYPQAGGATTFGLKGDPNDELPRQLCSRRNPTGCTIAIQVTVDKSDPTGAKCDFSGFPVVVVKGNQTLKWVLTETTSNTNAHFRDDAAGDDGIRIHQKPTAKRYKRRSMSPDMKSFQLERDDAIADEARLLLYDIYVDHDFGNKRCEPPDPIIINRD